MEPEFDGTTGFSGTSQVQLVAKGGCASGTIIGGGFSKATNMW